MGSYTILAPCAYAKDGRMVRHRTPGAVVELDDATAAKLGAAVQPATSNEAPAQQPAPEPELPMPPGHEAP